MKRGHDLLKLAATDNILSLNDLIEQLMKFPSKYPEITPFR